MTIHHHGVPDLLAEAERKRREAAALERLQRGKRKLVALEESIAEMMNERKQLLKELGIEEGEGA